MLVEISRELPFSLNIEEALFEAMRPPCLHTALSHCAWLQREDNVGLFHGFSSLDVYPKCSAENVKGVSLLHFLLEL